MFKRVLIGLVSVLLVGATVYGCNKGEEKPAAPATPAADAGAPAAPAADAAAPAAAPAADAAAPAAAEDATVPPEAKTASDEVFSVLFAIAAAGKKESCADVLAELKKLDNEDTKAKLEHGRYLQTLPADVQRKINEQNRMRMQGVVNELSSYQKCENSPEQREIDSILQKIMMPMMPEEAVRDAAALRAANGGDAAPADAAKGAVPAAAVDAAKDAVDAAAKDSDAAKAAVDKAIDKAVNDTEAAKAEAAKAIDGAVKDSAAAKAAANDVIDAAAKDPEAARAAAAKAIDAAAKDPDAAKAAIDAAARDPEAAKAAALEAMKKAQ